jgi:hypothetical protein
MAVVFGVRPAPRAGISLVSLYWQSKLPATSILSVTVPSVEAALCQIIGTVGEWGDLSAVAVAAPLTWSLALHGRREVDDILRKRLPRWASRTWLRYPGATAGAVAVQGPALVLALAAEIRQNQLPHHTVVECHPRLTLARLWPDSSASVTGYLRGSKENPRHIASLLAQFSDAGIVHFEDRGPHNAGELEALVAALTALGVAVPDAGLVVQQHAGGQVRPVGKRAVAVLAALP